MVKHTPNRGYEQWRNSRQQVEAIVADATLPLWQQAYQVTEAYTGLTLSDLTPDDQQTIIAGFARINAVLAGYTLNSTDDYESVHPKDLKAMVRIVRSLAPAP